MFNVDEEKNKIFSKILKMKSESMSESSVSFWHPYIMYIGII